MTELQALSHQEQMESARQEFDRLWHESILPQALRGCLMAIRHLCFHTFLVAKGLK